MKYYLDDLLVWAIILAAVITIALAFLRRKRIFIIIFGVLVILGALPTAFILEIFINGCCGAPSTGYEGAGYLIGGIMALAGILLIVFSDKLAKH